MIRPLQALLLTAARPLLALRSSGGGTVAPLRPVGKEGLVAVPVRDGRPGMKPLGGHKRNTKLT